MVRSYCIMCILSYAVNLLLLYFTWLVRKRFHCESIITGIILDLRHLLAYRRTIAVAAMIFLGSLLPIIAFFSGLLAKGHACFIKGYSQWDN